MRALSHGDTSRSRHQPGRVSPSQASAVRHRSRMLCMGILLGVATLCGIPCSLAFGQDASDFKPDQSRLPVTPPEGAIVLFDGKDHQFLSMSGDAINWPLEEGCLTSKRSENRVNHIVSKWHFRDADIHVEFNVSEKAEGNSGIYIHGNYELQIFNSYGKTEITEHDQGALYGFAKPLVNASKKPGEWQVYDIRYRAPRRDASGKITEPGSVTAWLNGQLVQDNTRFEEPRSVYHPFRYGTTPYLKRISERQRKTQVGPVFLQDHESPTRFRNVWIRPLDDQAMLYENSN